MTFERKGTFVVTDRLEAAGSQTAAPSSVPAPRIRDFDELYARHRRTLVGHLFHMVGHLDTAVELSHEAFLRAHDEPRLWADPDAKPVAWLYRVAGNLARNHLRDRARRAAAPPTDEPAAPIDPYEVIARRQDREGLVRAMASLPEAQRQALSLRYFADLSCRDVARALDMPEGTVVSLLYRARAALKRCLT